MPAAWVVQAPVGLDEEQHVVATEQGGVDGEEVAGHGGLGVQELRPRGGGPLWGGVDAVGREDLPDGGLGEAVAEAREFAVDASVAPGRVLGGEAKHESAELDRGGWSSWSSSGLGPVAGDALAVPAQQGVGGDEPAVSARGRGGGGAGGTRRSTG